MKKEQSKKTEPAQEDPRMPLTRRNYILLAIGFAVILLGFVLMTGGGSDSPDEFNYAMFSWRGSRWPRSSWSAASSWRSMPF